MTEVATKGDALRIKFGSVEVVHLVPTGTISGVAVELAAGKNGPGVGVLRNAGLVDGVGRISWRAPGSSTFGQTEFVSVDGSLLVHDGEDFDKWLRISVTIAFLATSEESAEVELSDVYENKIGSVDVIDSFAASGGTQTYTVGLFNAGNVILSDLRAWIQTPLDGLEISHNGSVWVDPTTEATALVLTPPAPGTTKTFWFRRTIAVGAPSVVALLRQVQFSFNGI